MAQVVVTEPWVRGTVEGQTSTGAYMTLSSAHDVTLIGASPPDASERLNRCIAAFGLRVLKSPPRSPKANALCERLIGTIRLECRARIWDWGLAYRIRPNIASCQQTARSADANSAVSLAYASNRYSVPPP
jgi:hypothetical protein